MSGVAEKFLQLGKSRFRIFFWKEMPAIKRVTAHLNGFVTPSPETPRPLGGLLRRIQDSS
jgi:hypothetical protein